MNYEAEPSRYLVRQAGQNQDRWSTRTKKVDPLSYLLVLCSLFFAELNDYLDATPEKEPRGIIMIKHLSKALYHPTLHLFPINYIQNIFQIIPPFILIFKVIRMFPNVNA